MPLDIVVGLQRGDEGKGRVTDHEAGRHEVVARGNGGANAGHTIVPEGMEPIALHQIPSGIAYPGTLNVIGNGVYLDPVRLRTEMAEARAAGLEISPDNLRISYAAQLVLPHHVMLDVLREGTSKAQDTTRAGISFVARDKYLRVGQRLETIEQNPQALGELAFENLKKANRNQHFWKRTARTKLYRQVEDWLAATEELKPYMDDTVELVNDRLQDGQNVLAEGAQGFWLDVNHGMYPEVTSSSTTAAGLLDGLGIAPQHVRRVIGVAKIIKSHVGRGPFVTEIKDDDHPELAERIRGQRGDVDGEYGATTKRARRVGYPDIFELIKAVKINGVNELVLTKADHVSRYGNEVFVAVGYKHRLTGEDLKAAPSSAHELELCDPVYEEYPTWDHIAPDARKFCDLPPEAVKVITLFRDRLQVPIKQVGVGPGRNALVTG